MSGKKSLKQDYIRCKEHQAETGKPTGCRGKYFNTTWIYNFVILDDNGNRVDFRNFRAENEKELSYSCEKCRPKDMFPEVEGFTYSEKIQCQECVFDYHVFVSTEKETGFLKCDICNIGWHLFHFNGKNPLKLNREGHCDRCEGKLRLVKEKSLEENRMEDEKEKEKDSSRDVSVLLDSENSNNEMHDEEEDLREEPSSDQNNEKMEDGEKKDSVEEPLGDESTEKMEDEKGDDIRKTIYKRGQLVVILCDEEEKDSKRDPKTKLKVSRCFWWPCKVKSVDEDEMVYNCSYFWHGRIGFVQPVSFSSSVNEMKPIEEHDFEEEIKAFRDGHRGITRGIRGFVDYMKIKGIEHPSFRKGWRRDEIDKESKTSQKGIGMNRKRKRDEIDPPEAPLKKKRKIRKRNHYHHKSNMLEESEEYVRDVENTLQKRPKLKPKPKPKPKPKTNFIRKFGRPKKKRIRKKTKIIVTRRSNDEGEDDDEESDTEKEVEDEGEADDEDEGDDNDNQVLPPPPIPNEEYEERKRKSLARRRKKFNNSDLEKLKKKMKAIDDFEELENLCMDIERNSNITGEQFYEVKFIEFMDTEIFTKKEFEGQFSWDCHTRILYKDIICKLKKFYRDRVKRNYDSGKVATLEIKGKFPLEILENVDLIDIGDGYRTWCRKKLATSMLNNFPSKLEKSFGMSKITKILLKARDIEIMVMDKYNYYHNHYYFTKIQNICDTMKYLVSDLFCGKIAVEDLKEYEKEIDCAREKKRKASRKK